MLFTDTDSLTYHIKSEDVFEGFFKRKHLFDFSNYPKDSKLFDETNKKVIGKMKDESEEKIINEFVGLKSKMYSMKKIVGKESNTAKGVNIATEFNEFKNILGTYKINKSISLSVFHDKRFVLHDGIHALAYFHKDLKKIGSHRRS